MGEVCYFHINKLKKYFMIDFLCFAFLRADVKNIVSTDKSIAVFVLELSIDVFLSLFQSNVHVSIKTCQNTWKIEIAYGNMLELKSGDILVTVIDLNLLDKG